MSGEVLLDKRIAINHKCSEASLTTLMGAADVLTMSSYRMIAVSTAVPGLTRTESIWIPW